MQLLEISTYLVALLGIGVSIWSYIDTRKKYYDEFIEERKNRKND
jgi:hypothetical protein